MFSSEYKNNINKENINPEFNNENIDENKVHNSFMELELNKTTDITPKINRENKTNFQALKRIENILSSNNNISSDKISFKTELKPLKIYPEKNVNKTFGRPESNNIFTYSNEEKYSLLKIKKIKNKKFSPYKSTNVLFNNVENFYDEQKNESDSKNVYFRMNKNKKIYSLRKDYMSIISFQDNKNNKKDLLPWETMTKQEWKKKVKEQNRERNEETKKDCIEPDSIGKRLTLDSVGSGDLERGGTEILPLDAGDAKHRMVRRPGLSEARK